MDKRTKTALIVAAVMIVAGFAISFASYGKGGGFPGLGWSFSPGSGVNFGSEIGYTVCRDGELRFAPEEVRQLEVEWWISGEVSVESYDGSTLLLREESDRELSDGQRMRWKLSGQRLSLRFCGNGQHNIPSKHLTVLVPQDWLGEEITVDTASAAISFRGLRVNETLKADATSGRVRLENCVCSSLLADTTSGAIELKDCRVRDTLRLSSTSGSADLSGCTAEKLYIDTTSGRVRFDGEASELHVDTISGGANLNVQGDGCRADVSSISGAVSLCFDGRPGQVEVETTSGRVELVFAEGTGLELDYDTVSGDMSGRALYFGEGGVPVKVDTISGDLKLEYR